MRSLRCRHGLIAMVGMLALATASAQAAPVTRKVDRDAAYLEEAFSHDLCTRDGRELHKLTKALSRKPVAVSR